MTSLGSIMPIMWWGISALSILILIFILIVILLFRRMKRFEASYVTLQTFMSGYELEPMLQKYIETLGEQNQEIKTCEIRLAKIEAKLRAAVDRAELLRFRAFENVGSDLSFAFALLNQEGSGVVLSAIHSREESRVYAKPITRGQSSYLLTDEEVEVIRKAMQGEKI
ncbi:DUF4446 family protein [Desulfosporosinus sp. OT]|uniref:DUF4446 family protein n=1 Tax=Desulfosporosinus sp. OT TaxID=913865 RepID=UPI000223AF1A|nr:DUF4446 family protein [Desulfosporosinus sp. OT]EGW39017.1 hypothetical protein DOT_3197 [Desulfosporosinus sp. OT]